MIFLFVVVSFALAAPPPPPPPPPPPSVRGIEGIHLSFGRNIQEEVAVQWQTPSSHTDPGAVYYTKVVSSSSSPPSPVQIAKADTRPLDCCSAGTRQTHVAVMTGLVPGSEYSYRIVAEHGTANSSTFRFVHQRKRPEGEPALHLLFGDMGSSHAFSICPACTAGSYECNATTCAGNASIGLVADAPRADMALHLGDFAYNFEDQNGYVGDAFMRNIEQIATRVPYMVAQGNHEDSDGNFAHFVERFRSMPSNAEPANVTTAQGETTNSLYFSWNKDLVHYVSISTELWFNFKWSVDSSMMLKWLEKDLEEANKNRAQVPWIIAQSHRSVYCTDESVSVRSRRHLSTSSDCTTATLPLKLQLEPILHKYGVDFWVNGHEHNYERTYPLYKGQSEKSYTDPKATIYVVSGAAGSQEMHEAFTKTPPSWTAFRSNTFGYNRFLIHNASHIRIQYVQTDPTLFPGSEYGRVIDDFWVVQNSHGPFGKGIQGTAFPEGDDSPERTYDHWEPLLSDLDGEPGKTSLGSRIRRFREKHGDVAWARREDELLATANRILGATEASSWEDVREDGSSDGAWFTWKSGGRA